MNLKPSGELNVEPTDGGAEVSSELVEAEWRTELGAEARIEFEAERRTERGAELRMKVRAESNHVNDQADRKLRSLMLSKPSLRERQAASEGLLRSTPEIKEANRR